MHRILSPGLIAFSLLLGLTGCSVFGGKAAEEPSHRVTLRDGDFEIREYLPYTVAQTTIPAPFDDAVDTGFGRLFKYILGDNRIDVKIDMTAPVVTEPARQKIAMTAPVLVESKADIGGAGKADLMTEMTDGWRISFVLPADYTAETAPEPKDPNVSLRNIDKRQIAAIRFSGRFRNEVAEENRQRLASWLESRGLAHFGDWKFAGYNPPWTIPALRRNEVMVTLR
ncbi:MAG TPA: heme-binding protein [Pirellulales bacterium]|nr:heme-binding protein [Pirellulales bacterium]